MDKGINPSALAIGGIVFVTLILSAFIYVSVAEGFRKYDLAVASIRAQRSILEDLLTQETAVRGYINTHQRALLEPYTHSVGQTRADLVTVDRYAESLHFTQSMLLVDRVRETYYQWETNVANLLIPQPMPDGLRNERVRMLLDSMRLDLEGMRNESKLYQDSIINQVRLTVIGGSLALLLSVVTLGLLAIVAESARRRQQRVLNEELDTQNRELERSNAALAEFAFIASHDLLEPLRTVTSYTQLLQRRYGEQLGSEAQEFIAYASDAARRMDQLVNDLLKYSRVSTARHFQPVESDREFRVALSNLHAGIEETGADVDAPAPLPLVMANPGQLTIVFQNLLNNAIKYRGERAPLVRVNATRRGAEWLFSVSDNGIGIAPEHCERIFKMFQRLHGRSEYDGTGIGLALVKRIIDLHGGRVWVESTPGEGSTFYFTLHAIA